MSKLYIPIAARRAAEEALKTILAEHAKKSEYVPFDNGRSVRRRIKGFDTYFYANRKA